VGSFSTNRRWAEWNGKFRDDVRRFLCGHSDMVATLATRIAGSADHTTYQMRVPGQVTSPAWVHVIDETGR
jgi:glycogen operon protein